MTPLVWRQLRALIRKDWQIEQRTRQALNTMIVFSVAVVLTFNFALEAELAAVRNVSLGLLWAIIWLAGTLGLYRSFSAEIETGALTALQISPTPRPILFIGKLVSSWLSLAILQIILVFLFTVLFDKPFYRPIFLLILALGSLGYVAAGVLVSSMAIQTRSSATLIPILLLPLTMPLVLACATTSAELLKKQPDLNAVTLPFLFIITFDLLILSAGYFLYNTVLEE